MHMCNQYVLHQTHALAKQLIIKRSETHVNESWVINITHSQNYFFRSNW